MIFGEHYVLINAKNKTDGSYILTRLYADCTALLNNRLSQSEIAFAGVWSEQTRSPESDTVFQTTHPNTLAIGRGW